MPGAAAIEEPYDHVIIATGSRPFVPPMEGVSGGGKVICPLHAHKFDLETGVGSEPHECVKIYAVREVDGEILLSV